MGYAWRREASNILKCVRRSKSKKTLKDIVQAMAEENFDIKKGMPLLAQFSFAHFSLAQIWSAPLISANS